MGARSLVGLMLLVSTLAACGSRPGDGGTDADASAVTCRVDPDCVATGVARPVASTADCYCADPCMGKVLNKETAATFAQQWEEHCSTLPEFTEECPLAMCQGSRTAICIEGRCWP
jgi:hypothetical protein